jgi:preprotein translocase subunit SecG
MENVVLVIHLILALCLIGVVLVQRSEGGGLGIGGGGGGAMTGRSAGTALGKLTWVFAIAFIVTSISLTIIGVRNSGDTSIIDRLGSEVSGDGHPDHTHAEGAAEPATGSVDPLTPPRAD